MNWSADIEEVHRRRRLAEECGGPDAAARHHAEGKLTVRERIARLLDPGSFQEVGKLAGHAEYGENGQFASFTPHPYVAGIGKIDGRPIAVGGEDCTIKGGSGSGSGRRKGGQGGFIEDLAWRYRIPLVNLIDGVGGSVESNEYRGHTTFPGAGQDGFERSVELLGVVPVVLRRVGHRGGRTDRTRGDHVSCPAWRQGGGRDCLQPNARRRGRREGRAQAIVLHRAVRQLQDRLAVRREGLAAYRRGREGGVPARDRSGLAGDADTPWAESPAWRAPLAVCRTLGSVP